jgi:hypothetical protein
MEKFPGDIDAAQAELLGSAGQVLDLGPFTSEITFTIIPIQERGDEMAEGQVYKTGTSMDTVREPQVPAQCGRLDEALEKLAVKLDELEDRLAAVLQSESPATNEKQLDHGPPQAELVPLARELASARRKVTRFTRNVDSIIMRLEV